VDISLYNDPFPVPDVGQVAPNHITPRITAQSGLFTIHPDPYVALDSSSITKLVIPLESREDVRKELHRLGINHASVFPDLDGIARHIAWEATPSS
jgi:hypothetical protein